MFTNIRRLTALLISLFISNIIIPFTVIAAEETGSITLSNAVVGETYHLFKVFDITYTPSLRAATYTKRGSSDPFLVALQSDASPFVLTQVLSTDEYVVDKKTTSGNFKEEITSFLKANESLLTEFTSATTSNIDSNHKAQSDSIKWENLPYGYYYVSTSTGSYVSLTDTAYNPTIQEKNTVPVFTAYQRISSQDSYTTDKLGGYINYPVYYKIDISPGIGNNKDMQIDSQLSRLDNISDIAVQLTANGATTVVDPSHYTLTSGTNSLKVIFPADYISTLTETDVLTITYQAILTKNAVTMSDQQSQHNYNQITFKYSNQTSTNTLYIETTKFTLSKTDETYNMLSGAQINIYKTETGGTPLKFKINNGTAYLDPSGTEDIVLNKKDIMGLPAGTYYIEETKAPPGYQKLTKRQAINVTTDNLGDNENGVITGGFWIVNKPGIALPDSGSSTGLILLGCASVCMVAGILLIAGSRHS